MAAPTVAAPAEGVSTRATPEPTVVGLWAVATVAAVVAMASTATTANRGPVGLVLAQFEVGIALAFVLVGHLVHRPVARAVRAGAPGPSLLGTWRRWAWRIVPAYWLVVAVTFLFPPAASGVRPTTDFSPAASGVTEVPLAALARAVAFLAPYAPGSTVAPDAWLWPVAAVVAFIVVVPASWRLIERRAPDGSAPGREIRFIAALAGVGIAAQVALALVSSDGTRAMTWMPAHLALFALGMATARLAVRPDGETPRPLERWAVAPAAPFAGAALALVVLVGVAVALDLPRLGAPVGGADGLVRHLAHLVAAAAVAVPLLVRPRPGPVRPAVATVLATVGTLGYGLYLWAGPLLARWVSGGGLDDAGGAARHAGRRYDLPLVPGLLWTLIGGLVLAALTWLLVQRPLRRFETAAMSRFAAALSAIGLASLATRIWSFGTVMDRNPGNGDPFFYHAQANMLADGVGFGEPIQWLLEGRFVPSAIHPPLFTLWLTPASLIGSRSFLSHKTLAAVAGVGVVVVAALLARRLAGDRAGIIAGVLVALYPNLWIIDGTLWPEGLYTFTVGLTLLAAYRWRDGPTLGRAALVGAGVGASILTRGEALLLLPLLCLPLAWSGRRLAARWFLHAVVMGAVAVALVAPWTIRNAVQFSHLVPVSTNSDEVLYYANCPDTYDGPFIGYWSFNCQERERAARVERGLPADPPGDEAERAAAWGDLGRQYARDNRDRLPAVVAARVTRVWDVRHADNNARALVLEGRPLEWNRAGLWTYRLLAVPAVVGLWLVHRRRPGEAWPLVAMLAMITATAIYAYGHVRFRTVGDLVVVVGAAVALDALWRRVRPAPARPSRPGAP